MKYLGKELSDEQIKSIVDFCSFDNMKKNPAFEVKSPAGMFAKNVLGVEHKPDETEKKAEQAQAPAKMKELKIFRKGKVGDWKNYFTDEMSKRLDEVVAANLKYTKPFKYELTS